MDELNNNDDGVDVDHDIIHRTYVASYIIYKKITIMPITNIVSSIAIIPPSHLHYEYHRCY